MFILRQIFKDGVVSNQVLGHSYSVSYRDTHKKDFCHLLGNTDHHPDAEKIFAILVINDGQRTWPLYEGFEYYIMTDSGKTFDNLTFKK